VNNGARGLLCLASLTAVRRIATFLSYVGCAGRHRRHGYVLTHDSGATTLPAHRSNADGQRVYYTLIGTPDRPAPRGQSAAIGPHEPHRQIRRWQLDRGDARAMCWHCSRSGTLWSLARFEATTALARTARPADPTSGGPSKKETTGARLDPSDAGAGALEECRARTSCGHALMCLGRGRERLRAIVASRGQWRQLSGRPNRLAHPTTCSNCVPENAVVRPD